MHRMIILFISSHTSDLILQFECDKSYIKKWICKRANDKITVIFKKVRINTSKIATGEQTLLGEAEELWAEWKFYWPQEYILKFST